jgi:hypothetical protein
MRKIQQINLKYRYKLYFCVIKVILNIILIYLSKLYRCPSLLNRPALEPKIIDANLKYLIKR